MSLILDMPMDEPKGSKIAYDFSGNNMHAELRGGVSDVDFGAGKFGNALHFMGNGYAIIRDSVNFIQSEFTFMFWAMNKQINPYPSPGGLVLKLLADDVIYQLPLPISTGVWHHIAIRRTGNLFEAFINGSKIIATLTVSATIDEWVIEQVFTESSNTFNYTFNMTFGAVSPRFSTSAIDNVLIYGDSLPDEEIIGDYNGNKRNRVFWLINGIDFTNYGVYVSESDLLLTNASEVKTQMENDWKEYHGKIVNVDIHRVTERTISLNCFIRATGKIDFVTKFNDFLTEFRKSGLRRLKCEIDRNKPLVWDVYLKDGISVEKRWRDNEMFGTFELKLREPVPVKRVLRFNATDSSKLALVDIKFGGIIDVFWGDGTYDTDIDASDIAKLRHTYATNGKYEIAIYCEPDEIKYFYTNAIQLWSRL